MRRGVHVGRTNDVMVLSRSSQGTTYQPLSHNNLCWEDYSRTIYHDRREDVRSTAATSVTVLFTKNTMHDLKLNVAPLPLRTDRRCRANYHSDLPVADLC